MTPENEQRKRLGTSCISIKVGYSIMVHEYSLTHVTYVQFSEYKYTINMITGLKKKLPRPPSPPPFFRFVIREA